MLLRNLVQTPTGENSPTRQLSISQALRQLKSSEQGEGGGDLGPILDPFYIHQPLYSKCSQSSVTRPWHRCKAFILDQSSKYSERSPRKTARDQLHEGCTNYVLALTIS